MRIEKNTRLRNFSWFVLCFNLFVIVLGGYVRASGSGAGCGSHWPLCNGEIVPQAPAIATIIEFTHRITSGLTVVLILVLFVWVWRIFPRGHILRWTTAASVFFIFTEALIGAGLVLFHLVQDNDSIVRALSMMAHLVNTFLLLMALALTAWFLTFRPPQKMRFDQSNFLVFALGVVGMFVLGASGAVTALGDTLFPSFSLAEGFQQDFSTAAHYLLRLRVFHPPIAIIVGIYVASIGWRIYQKNPSTQLEKLTKMLFGFVGFQFGFGLLNIWLLAPIWLQMLHLLMTMLIWVTYVLIGISGLVAGYFSTSISEKQVQNGVHQPSSQ